MEGAEIVQYADDSQVMVSGRVGEIRALVKLMERNLLLLAQWFAKNGMKVNAQKTQMIIFGSRQNLSRLPPISVHFMGATVAVSPTVSNLGVTFDQRMSFSAHVDDIVRKCTGMLCGLMHAKHYLPKSVLITLVQALVVSRLRYCIAVYGCCNSTELKRVQKLLNFAARVISGRRKFDHISDVLGQLNWLSADNLYMYHGLTLLKRVLATSEPEVLSRGLTTRGEVHQRVTRNADLLVTPTIHSEAGRRRFRYCMVAAFNDLPSAIREANTTTFKNEVRKHLQSKQRGNVG